MEKEIFTLDPTDQDGICQIMDQYGDSETSFFGQNDNGEDIMISVFKEKIVTETFQSNGWSRKNIYNRDGTREELYEGRWDDPQVRGPKPAAPKADYKRGFQAGFKAGFQEAKQKYQHEPTHRQTMQ